MFEAGGEAGCVRGLGEGPDHDLKGISSSYTGSYFLGGWGSWCFGNRGRHLNCVCAAPIAPYSLMCREGAEARVMPATDPVAVVVVAG